MTSHRFACVLVALTFLCPLAVAQNENRGNPRVAPPTMRNPELTVRVQYETGFPTSDPIMVDLLSSYGGIVARGATDGSGRVRFPQVSPGNYTVKATGPNIEDSESAAFYIYPGQFMHNESLTVRPRSNPNAQASPGGVISANDLKAPDKAKKEYRKGTEAISGKKWEKAAEHFRKALEIYPQFDAAYSALGAVYLQQNDAPRAEETFRKGLEVNSANATIQRQLGRILVRSDRFEEADGLLKKAVAANPQDEVAFALLAYAQLKRNNMPDALANARRAHEMQNHQSAFVHLIAAECLEGQQKDQEAVSEYRQYLKEAPESADAKIAKEALARLEKK